MGSNENSTLVITDIQAALKSAENEAKDKPAALLAVGGDKNGTLFDLRPGENNVGRNPENQIQLEIEGISRAHFQIILSDDCSVAKLKDLGSRNGTFLNDQKIASETQLRQGDVIKVGSTALKYLPKGDTERLTYDKLQLEANTDRHTGCFNKTYFNLAIDKEVSKSKKSGSPLTLIIFDLDHFKKLNDNFGHDAGDFVLKELAQVIRGTGLKENSVFARYGGEEFVILLPETNLKTGFAIAEKLRRTVEAHDFMYEGKKLPVTASIGLSDYRKGVNVGVDLFKRADEAVYQSKQGGRNRVSFYKSPQE